MASLKALKTAFKDQLSLVFLEKNLVDEVWAAARPAYSKNPLTVLPESYTGESSASKVERLRKKMSENKSALLLACALDEVAWLFNLRGADIPFNPVFRSYALLAADSVTLYVDVEKVTAEVKAHLGDSVRVRPYDTLLGDLRIHAQHSRLGPSSRIWLDPAKCSAAISAVFTEQQGGADSAASMIFEQDNPIQLMKCVKNSSELAGMRHAHVKDAVAMVNFLQWIEEQLVGLKRTDLTECSVADKLESFRAEQHDFVGLSFETIAGAGPNGAIIHYKSYVDDWLSG
jgi:Xaa-Pro aminopeptidase